MWRRRSGGGCEGWGWQRLTAFGDAGDGYECREVGGFVPLCKPDQQVVSGSRARRGGVHLATDGEASEPGFVRRELLGLAGWGALLAPAGIILHEMGHFLVGLSLGFPVRLNAGSVSGGPAIGSATDMAVAMQASAGPLVTITLMAIAAWGLINRPGSRWAFALAITAPLRFIVGGTYLFWVGKAWLEETAFQGTPNFDEFNAALALGLSPVWLVAVQVLGLIAFWIWATTRPRPIARIASVGSVLAGAVIGIALWMALIGPALLSLA